MKKIKYIFLALATVMFLYNCEDTYVPDAAAYVTFGESDYSTGIDVGGSTTVDIPVFTADVVSTDRTFELTTDGSGAASGSYSVPTSVTVPAGTNEGTFTVSLSDIDLGIGVNKVVIGLMPEAGLSTSGDTTISYIQNCTEVTATLDFIFDFYSSETGWYITDSLDGVVVEGGGYSDGQGTASESIALCAGRDYTLFVTDAFGDGMDDGSFLGSYTLTIGGVVVATGGGSFGESESNAFDTK